MSTEADQWLSVGARHGFTLIEVIGALVLFSVGVLIVMRVGSTLTTQMRISGARSEIVVLASEQVDSIESIPYDSISAGAWTDTLTVQGWLYQRAVAVTRLTPVLGRLDVSLTPVGGSSGPSHTVTSYTSAAW